MSGLPSRRVAALMLTVGVMLGLTACGSDDGGGSSAAPSESTADSSAATTDPSAGDHTVGSGVTDYLEYTGGSAGAADKGKSPIIIGWVNQQGGPSDVGPDGTKGCRDDGEVHQPGARRHRRPSARAADLLHVDVRGAGPDLRAEDGQRQRCERHRDGCRRDRRPIPRVDRRRRQADGLQRLHRRRRRQELERLRALRRRRACLRPVRNLRQAGAEGQERRGGLAGDPGHQRGVGSDRRRCQGQRAHRQERQLVAQRDRPRGSADRSRRASADVIITSPDPKGCVNLSKALTSLSVKTPIVSEPLCLNATVAKALGDLPPWYYGIATSLATDTSDPASVAFMKIATKYGLAKEGASDVWIANAFGVTLTIAQWMNKIGADKITPEAIAAQAKAFKGPMVYGAPTVTCGKYPEAPAVCNDQTKFFKYEGKGEFTPASGWVRPPA